MWELDEITGGIVDSAFRIHSRLGPGLFESVYEALLFRSLEQRGFRVERQKTISFEWEGLRFEDGFRVDLLVEEQVIVELKSVDKLTAAHMKQVLTYLRLTDLRIGLLINFGAPTLKEGLRRIVNNHSPARASALRLNHPAPLP